MRAHLITVPLRVDRDLVAARQRARHVAQQLGFDAQDQSRIATAVSELARNAVRYATGGRLTFTLVGASPPQLLEIEVRDDGPGIPHLEDVLSGRYRSTSGMGQGLVGTRRLTDQFAIESSPQGTIVHARKLLPARAPFVSPAEARRVASRLLEAESDSPLAELEQQNRELLRALDELRRRQDELTELNRELADTNRGVVALYAELDEKAEHLRRADALKSRFLSNMSHEFRTPVSSIIAISRILLDRLDGDLTSEQEHQVRLIQHAAEDLSELVTDLLDLAKVEAGKTVVRSEEFEVGELFGTLRGMLRPLMVNPSVSLVFEDTAGLPRLHTDKGKISQILRNFLSNALKFTERGEVRVSARPLDGDSIALSVADTGIGIAREHLDTIFEEFSQLEHPVQQKVRGTGLGLPLSRKLARLLGGEVQVESTPGEGSTFRLIVPVVYRSADVSALPGTPVRDSGTGGIAVLVVVDAGSDAAAYRSMLGASEFSMHAAAASNDILEAVEHVRPSAIVLDLQPGAEVLPLLARLRQHPVTGQVPVLVAGAADDASRALALGAYEYRERPVDRGWLIQALRRATGVQEASVLVVEDHASWRDAIGRMLHDLNCRVTFATTAAAAIAHLEASAFDLLSLDLGLPDRPGTDVIDLIRGRMDLNRVIVITGGDIETPVLHQLSADGARIIRKQDLAEVGTRLLREALGAVHRTRGVHTP